MRKELQFSSMIRRTVWQALGIWLLFAASVLIWNHIDTRPPAWDESVHLNLALDYKAWLLHGTPVTSPWASIYPPLYQLALIPGLSLRAVPSVAVAINVLCALILLWAMVSVSRDLGRSQEEGLLAGLLVLGGGISLWMARRALIDFSIVCWVTGGMALLLRTDQFKKYRETLIWAIWSGLGMLIKPYYPIYFVLPCLILLGQGIASARSTEHPIWNFIKAVGIIILFSLPWYGWRWAIFFSQTFSMMSESGVARGNPSVATLEGWLFYIVGLRDQWGAWSLAFLAVGFVMLGLRWKENRGQWFLFAWFLSGYLAWTVMRTKNPRFTVGYMPAVALLGVFGWIPLLKGSSWLRGLTSLSESIWWRRSLWAACVVLLIANTVLYDPPKHENWQHYKIGHFLASRRDPTQPFLIASVLSNHPYLFGRNLRWSVRAQGQTMATQSTGDPNADFTEFVVVKTGNDLGPDDADLRAEWKRQQVAGRAFSEVFPKVASFPLPDGSEAEIYQRNPDTLFRIRAINQDNLQRHLAQALRGYIQGPMRVRIGGTSADWKRGRIEWAEIEGGPWKVKDIPVAKARIRLEKVWLNLYRLWDQGRPGLMAFGSIAPSVEIKASDLETLLKAKVKSLEEAHVHFVGGQQLEVQGVIRGWRVGAKARVTLRSSPPRLVAVVQHVSVQGFPIPGWLFGMVHRQEVPLDPIPSFPGAIRVQHVTLDNDVLRITS